MSSKSSRSLMPLPFFRWRRGTTARQQGQVDFSAGARQAGRRRSIGMTDGAAAIIEKLNLAPHPEGGWYRETWRPEAPPGERAGATAIHFLLEAHQRSHWH